ncbi:MAG: HAD family hydrolase [Acidobacteriota bacterium]
MLDLALFDYDGTITREDIFTMFLRHAISPARAVWGGLLVSPFVLGYRLGALEARHVRPLVSGAGFAGRSAEAVRVLGASFAEEVLPDLVRPEAEERIQWHRERGDFTVVVSASLDAYLRPWCTRMSLACICTQLEERHGRLTGRYTRGDCSGPNKVARLREAYDLRGFGSIHAYGDTAEDDEMLALADHAHRGWPLEPRA